MGLFVFSRDEDKNITINNAKDDEWGVFPWSPSWGEINYHAYDLATVEFHNELYGQIQEKGETNSISDTDTFLSSHSIDKYSIAVVNNI